MLIKPASEIEQYLKVLVYGDPGSGKTVLSATATEHEDLCDVLIVNIEGGILSVANTPAFCTEQLKTVSEVESIIWSLANKEKGFENFKTIVIDSGTELQTINLEGIVRASMKKHPSKERGEDDVFIEDYGKSNAQLKRIFRQFRDLPMNVIVTALTKRVVPTTSTGKAKHPTYVGPLFTERLANSLMGYMDSVWCLTKEDSGKRFLLTQSQSPYVAKTRGMRFSEAIGNVVENPNLAELYETLLKTEGNS